MAVYCTLPTTGLSVSNTWVNLRFLAFCEHIFYLRTEKLIKWSSPLFKELCADLDTMISHQQIHKQIFLSPPGTTLCFSVFFLSIRNCIYSTSHTCVGPASPPAPPFFFSLPSSHFELA